MWDYVKAEGLQDSKNRRMINADDKLLLDLLAERAARSSMFDMAEGHQQPRPVARTGELTGDPANGSAASTEAQSAPTAVGLRASTFFTSRMLPSGCGYGANNVARIDSAAATSTITKRRLVTGYLLDVAADHAGGHHAQATHQRRRERVVRDLVRTGRDLLHHVQNVPDGAEAPAQLLQRHDRRDDVEVRRHRLAEMTGT